MSSNKVTVNVSLRVKPRPTVAKSPSLEEVLEEEYLRYNPKRSRSLPFGKMLAAALAVVIALVAFNNQTPRDSSPSPRPSPTPFVLNAGNAYLLDFSEVKDDPSCPRWCFMEVTKTIVDTSKQDVWNYTAPFRSSVSVSVYITAIGSEQLDLYSGGSECRGTLWITGSREGVRQIKFSNAVSSSLSTFEEGWEGKFIIDIPCRNTVTYYINFHQSKGYFQ